MTKWQLRNFAPLPPKEEPEMSVAEQEQALYIKRDKEYLERREREARTQRLAARQALYGYAYDNRT